MAITSKIEKNEEYLIKNWEDAGLLKPSAIKPVISTIEKSVIIKNLGELSEEDFPLIVNILNDILGLCFLTG